MSSISGKLPIPAFSGKDEDWLKWNARFQAHMKSLGLKDILIGTTTRPEGEGEGVSAQQLAYDKRNTDIFTYLINTCEGEAFTIVNNIKNENGAVAWNHLVARFRSSSETRKRILESELNGMEKRVKSNDHVRAELDKVLSLKQQLEEIGTEVPDSQLYSIIEGMLPREFLTYLTQLRKQKDTSLQEVITEIKLFSDVIRRQDEQDKEHESIQAALAAEGRPGKWRRTMTDDGQVQTRQPNFVSQRNQRFPFPCHNCGKPGHKRAECFKPGGGAHDPTRWRQGRNVNNSAPSINQEWSMVATVMEQEQDQTQEAHLAMGNSHHQYWLVDSGATMSMTNELSDFAELDTTKNFIVKVANNDEIKAIGVGSVRLWVCTTSGQQTRVTLNSVLLVPKLGKRLFSVAAATSQGNKFCFDKEGGTIEGVNGSTIKLTKIGTAKYVLPSIIEQKTDDNSAKLWHQRLGHANHQTLSSAATQGVIPGINFAPMGHQQFCEPCALAKSHRAPQPRHHVPRPEQVGQLIYSDVFGPVNPESMSGKSYAVVFVDATSRMRFVYFMKRKSEVPTILKQFLIEIAALQIHPTRLHSDNGGEYRSKEIADVCTEWKIHQTFTAPHSPAQNGVAERSWRTLLEKTRCLLFQAAMGNEFWTAAMQAATYATNRIPSQSIHDKTPFELWVGKPPTLPHMKTFGCDAYVHKEGHTKKLDERSWKGKFIGYDTHEGTHLGSTDKASKAEQKCAVQ
jgi:transposase InsO family protein